MAAQMVVEEGREFVRDGARYVVDHINGYVGGTGDGKNAFVFARRVGSKREIPRTFGLWGPVSDESYDPAAEYAQVSLKTFRAEWTPA